MAQELLNYRGWFDIDNLKKIAREDLRAAIGECCSVVIFLHDETVDSEWCQCKATATRAQDLGRVPLLMSGSCRR